MEKSFFLSIVTPLEVFYEGRAVSLIAPCALGYLGVLADHAPLAANTIPGKITVRRPDGDPVIIRAGGQGILEVLKNNVTLLYFP